jgi:hypothetical protein
MKRTGRMGSIDGRTREICKMDADDVDVDTDESGGIYMPDSRKDLMFDMRRSEDADGESKMMGSGRRGAALGFMESAGLLAILDAAGCCDFLAMKGIAILRT